VGTNRKKENGKKLRGGQKNWAKLSVFGGKNQIGKRKKNGVVNSEEEGLT
jgi:hypothetical protein